MGAAVIFSGSLLHQVTRVTHGRRYAFLPFLHDEEAERIRVANLSRRSIRVKSAFPRLRLCFPRQPTDAIGEARHRDSPHGSAAADGQSGGIAATRIALASPDRPRSRAMERSARPYSKRPFAGG